MHILMAVAEFEHSLISERNNAGLDAAKARREARPVMRLSPTARAALAAWKTASNTVRDLASLLGVSVDMAQKLIKGRRKALRPSG